MGSWLDARAAGGRWLLRFEDLDRPRCVPGAEDDIRRTLEAFALEWDGPVVRQSERAELYERALRTLGSQHLLFRCDCTRRRIALAPLEEPRCVSDCRARQSSIDPARSALRAELPPAATPTWVDRLQGTQPRDGCPPDVVVRRRDGVITYQLAVSVDDADQGITNVVRGADLLASTPIQLALLGALGAPAPRYAHLPVVVEPDGAKLSKSRRSIAVDAQARTPAARSQILTTAMGLLLHPPPPELSGAPPRELLNWAHGNWTSSRLAGVAVASAPR